MNRPVRAPGLHGVGGSPTGGSWPVSRSARNKELSRSLAARLHPDRTPGCDRDYRDPRQHAVASSGAGQAEGPTHQVRLESQTGGHCLHAVLDDNRDRFPTNDQGIDYTYYSWGGKVGQTSLDGVVVGNQYACSIRTSSRVAPSRPTKGGPLWSSLSERQRGDEGRLGKDLKPTVYDVDGSSHSTTAAPTTTTR